MCIGFVGMTLQSCGFLKRSLAGLSGWVCGGTVPEFLLRAVGKSSPAAFTWKAGLVGSILSMTSIQRQIAGPLQNRIVLGQSQEAISENRNSNLQPVRQEIEVVFSLTYPGERMKETHTPTHSCMHSFMQHICTEHLLCSRCWSYRGDLSLIHGGYRLVGQSLQHTK